MASRTFIEALLSVGAGVSIATLILLASGTVSQRPQPSPGESAPIVIIPENHTVLVPAYQNTTVQNGGPTLCGENHDCGLYGVTRISFNLSTAATLSGEFNSNEPLRLGLATGSGIRNMQCYFFVPPANCSFAAGPGYISLWPVAAGNTDLANLNFHFLDRLIDGTITHTWGSNVLPPGSWILYLVNSSNGLASVDALLSIEGTPNR